MGAEERAHGKSHLGLQSVLVFCRRDDRRSFAAEPGGDKAAAAEKEAVRPVRLAG